jgi:hypothetical protein
VAAEKPKRRPRLCRLPSTFHGHCKFCFGRV